MQNVKSKYKALCVRISYFYIFVIFIHANTFGKSLDSWILAFLLNEELESQAWWHMQAIPSFGRSRRLLQAKCNSEQQSRVLAFVVGVLSTLSKISAFCKGTPYYSNISRTIQSIIRKIFKNLIIAQISSLQELGSLESSSVAKYAQSPGFNSQCHNETRWQTRHQKKIFGRSHSLGCLFLHQ